MSGPKRNPDRLNTIGIVVVGLCGAVLVYVTIVALEAFYVNDTSEVQSTADYGGQETAARSLRTDQLSKVGEYGSNPKPAPAKPGEAQRPQSYRVPVEVAMKLVVDGARTDPSNLIPSMGRSDKATVLPIFGRPKIIPPAPAAPAAGAPAAAPGAGSAADLPAAPQAATGAGTGPSPVGGAGALESPGPNPQAKPGAAPPVGTAAPATAPKATKPGSTAPKAGSGADSAKGNGK